MRHPTVSVVIPTRRRAVFLRKALESALLQSYPALEIIVVENGSSSEGKIVVAKLKQKEPRIKYLYEATPSASRARNAGMQAAKGDYVAFLDDDDEWLPMKLERQIQIASQDPQVGIVTCLAWQIREDSPEHQLVPSHRGEITLKTLLSEGNCIWSASSVLVRKECIDLVGYFIPQFDPAEDFQWYIRIAKKYRIAQIEDPLFYYRVHSSNISVDRIRMLKTTIRLLKSADPAPEDGVTYATIRSCISTYVQQLHDCAEEAMDRKNFRTALIAYFFCITGSPLIGLRVKWNRFSHPLYRVLRPYLATLYCALNVGRGLQSGHHRG